MGGSQSPTPPPLRGDSAPPAPKSVGGDPRPPTLEPSGGNLPPAVEPVRGHPPTPVVPPGTPEQDQPIPKGRKDKRARKDRTGKDCTGVNEDDVGSKRRKGKRRRHTVEPSLTCLSSLPAPGYAEANIFYQTVSFFVLQCEVFPIIGLCINKSATS